MKKWIVVVLLVLVAAVAWKEMNKNGGGLRLPGTSGELVNTLPPSSPHHAQQQEFIDRFNADPELRDRFAGSFTSKGLYAEVNFALKRGAQSLDGPSLVRVTRSMAAVIPRLPEKSCAKLIRRRDDFDRELSRDMDDALARLPAVHHRNLWDFYLRALKAEVDDLPIRPVDDEHLRIALQELGGNYNGREAERIQSVMKNTASAPDADACWAINTMTFGATQLSPQSAEAMARLIWAGGE
jgi:hypothetical protein